MFLLSKSPNTGPELTKSHLQCLGMIELWLLLCLSSLSSAPTNIQSVTGLFEFPNQTPYDTHLEINNHGFPAVGVLQCPVPGQLTTSDTSAAIIYSIHHQPTPSPPPLSAPNHNACLNTRYIQYVMSLGSGPKSK